MSEHEMSPEQIAAKAHEVKRLLQTHGIDTTVYGTGSAKTIEHLAKELIAGECTLTVDETTGELVRTVELLAIDVLHQTPDGRWLRLVEARQDFADGRTRVRDIPQSLGEKMTQGEDIEAGVARALKEELGIDKTVAHYDIGESSEEIMSPSYPGINSYYVAHQRVVAIGGDDFRPEGYQEVQADKTTTWEWVELQSA